MRDDSRRLSSPSPPITVAIVSWNTRALLARCLQSLKPDVDMSLEGAEGAVTLINLAMDRSRAAAQAASESQSRRFREISRKAYRSLGGVAGALAQHAEETLESMSPPEQRLVLDGESLDHHDPAQDDSERRQSRLVEEP